MVANMLGVVEHGDESWALLHPLEWRHPPLDHLQLLGCPHRQHPLPHGGTQCFPSHPQVHNILQYADN